MVLDFQLAEHRYIKNMSKASMAIDNVFEGVFSPLNFCFNEENKLEMKSPKESTAAHFHPTCSSHPPAIPATRKRGISRDMNTHFPRIQNPPFKDSYLGRWLI